MTTALERILIMRSRACFAGLSVGRVAAIARLASAEWLPAGATWAPGSSGQSAIVVASGSVSVDDPNLGLRPVEPGEVIGLVEVLASSRLPTVHCHAETELLVLAAADFEDLCEEEFDVVEALLRWLANRILSDTTAMEAGNAIEGYRSGGDSPMPPDATPFVRKLAALADSGLLPDDQLDAMAELARHAEFLFVPADAKIWQAGEEADSFLTVIDGDIRCEGDGGWHSHLGPYSMAGDLEAMAGIPRRFTAMADSALCALRIGRDSFMDILEDHPRLSVDFLATLARRALRHTERALTE